MSSGVKMTRKGAKKNRESKKKVDIESNGTRLSPLSLPLPPLLSPANGKEMSL